VRLAERWDLPTLSVLLPERPVRPWDAGLRAAPPSCSR
jgi:hypothetical protein